MKLINEQYEVTFKEAGGEIASFKDKDTQMEYMWQGDPAYWTGQNPTLFPLVGNTYTKDYTIDGVTYAMKNHGLIRYANLTCIQNEKDTITFQYLANDETKKQYPFSFDYRISYQLIHNKLTITYRIKNTDTKVMPFSFGLHPAFNCPLEKDERFEDYKLHFSHPEDLKQIITDKERKQPPTIMEQGKKIRDVPIHYDWIEKYATVIYKDIKSDYVTLQGKHHGVRVSCMGYPLLAFWTAKKGAPFLCIEPWIGHGDFYDTKKEFDERDYTMKLSPGKIFTSSYTIEVF